MADRAEPYGEDDLLPISALQHLLFCERQAALIHVEQVWADNPLTVEGTHLHQRVDEGPDDTRASVRTVRGLAIRSLRLGVSGRADVVEFYPDGQVVPVEYKRGRVKAHDADVVQLCAQALCLEEMLGASVPSGALFYGQTRRRSDVTFDRALRDRTRGAAERLRAILTTGITPRAVREPKCDSCSLIDLCLPSAMEHHRTASAYLRDGLDAALASSGLGDQP